MAVHVAVAGDRLVMVSFLLPFFPREMWIRSGTELSQFLRVFLPTLGYGRVRLWLQILHMNILVNYTALPHHSVPILIPYTDNPILPIPSGHKYGKTEKRLFYSTIGYDMR